MDTNDLESNCRLQHISAGCKFCYALTTSKRLKAMGSEKYRNGFKLTLHTDSLNAPYQWKTPKTVFVNSMSDLFHKDIPLEFIKKVFKVMNENPQHTFQVLTKRADVLYDLQDELKWTPNIWMGVSVENEKVVGRIEYLRKVGAKIKFLSLEPLIGPLPDLKLNKINWVIVGSESGYKASSISYFKKGCMIISKKSKVENTMDKQDKLDVMANKIN